MRRLFALPLVAAALMLTSCGGAYYGGRYNNYPGYGYGYYAPGPPPPPIYESYGYAPGPGYVWTRGYYTYNGGRYSWRPGQWVRPPHPRARWREGEWRHNRHGYYYSQGHWR